HRSQESEERSAGDGDGEQHHVPVEPLGGAQKLGVQTRADRLDRLGMQSLRSIGALSDLLRAGEEDLAKWRVLRLLCRAPLPAAPGSGRRWTTGARSALDSWTFAANRPFARSTRERYEALLAITIQLTSAITASRQITTQPSGVTDWRMIAKYPVVHPPLCSSGPATSILLPSGPWPTAARRMKPVGRSTLAICSSSTSPLKPGRAGGATGAPCTPFFVGGGGEAEGASAPKSEFPLNSGSGASGEPARAPSTKRAIPSPATTAR